MPQSLSEVVVLTSQHAFSGRLDLGEMRLSEFMNDRRETVMRLRETAVSLLDKPSQVIAHHTEAVVLKQVATIVFERQPQVIRPDKRLYSYVKKKEHRVHIVAATIEVEGYLHTVGNLDLKRIVSMPDQQFIPITQPVLSLLSSTRYVLKPNTVIVNTAHIQYIAQLPEKPSESTAEPIKDQKSTIS